MTRDLMHMRRVKALVRPTVRHLTRGLGGPGGSVNLGTAHTIRVGPEMVEVTNEEFEQLVEDAIDSLPDDLGAAMENVAVFVDDQTPASGLLGLYQGIPLTERGTSYSVAMPDRITIYKSSICRICNTEAEVVEQVRHTVIHEVAHHFGIDDDRLEELGWA